MEGKFFFSNILSTFIKKLIIGVAMNNNLFVQRRFQVQKDRAASQVHFIGSLYVAYYFYVNNELFVSKYALCVKYTKSETELKQLMKK